MSSKKLSNTLIIMGATIAIVLGIIHLYIGFPIIANTLSESGVSSVIWGKLLKAIWIIFAVPLFFISALFLDSVWRHKALPAIAVFFCGLLPILDGAILASFAPLINLGFGIPGLFFIVGGILAAQPDLRQETYSV